MLKKKFFGHYRLRKVFTSFVLLVYSILCTCWSWNIQGSLKNLIRNYNTTSLFESRSKGHFWSSSIERFETPVFCQLLRACYKSRLCSSFSPNLQAMDPFPHRNPNPPDVTNNPLLCPSFEPITSIRLGMTSLAAQF